MKEQFARFTREQLEETISEIACRLEIVRDGTEIHFKAPRWITFSPNVIDCYAYDAIASAATVWDLPESDRYKITSDRKTKYAPDYSWKKPGFVAKVWDTLHNREAHETAIETGPGAKQRALAAAQAFVARVTP